jgi:hypothetical protein
VLRSLGHIKIPLAPLDFIQPEHETLAHRPLIVTLQWSLPHWTSDSSTIYELCHPSLADTWHRPVIGVSSHCHRWLKLKTRYRTPSPGAHRHPKTPEVSFPPHTGPVGLKSDELHPMESHFPLLRRSHPWHRRTTYLCCQCHQWAILHHLSWHQWLWLEAR